MRGGILLLITLASAQALGYAGALLWQAPATAFPPWNHDGSDPVARMALRGMPARVAAPGDRVVLWPGVRGAMRASGRASTDWADAGQVLVTAWTKNRTTAALVGPNGFLFDQAIELTPEAICDVATVSFLRLRHLIVPPGQRCEGWVTTGARIDDRWALATWVGGEDPRVRAIPADALTDALRDEPALQSGLARQLVPQDGSVVRIDQRRHEVLIGERDRGSSERDQVLVLPVAYDRDWRVSSGRTMEVGGLLGITGAAGETIRVWFAPGAGLRVRAIGTAAAQALAVFGLVAFGFGPWKRTNHNVA
jgi:hypothetical protein